jgi:hypothetical protein
VFDDPFNSQDAFRRRQTVHEIVKLASTAAQVIVLSHDATFLKQIWDKSAPGERKALLIADQRAQGSKLLPADLEKATQGRTVEEYSDAFDVVAASNVHRILSTSIGRSMFLRCRRMSALDRDRRPPVWGSPPKARARRRRSRS